MNIINDLPPVLEKGTLCAIDTEIYGARLWKLHRPKEGKFASIQFCPDGETVYVVTEERQVAEAIKRVSKASPIFHNAKFDITHIRNWCKYPERDDVIDTMMLERILWSGFYDTFGLKDLARRYLNEIVDKKEREEFSDRTEMTREMLVYSARDASLTWRIYHAQREEVSKKNWHIYNNIDLPAMYAVLDFKGFKMDVDKWLKIAKVKGDEAEKLREGFTFNPNSPKQVLVALQGAGLRKLTSTGADELAPYREHPLVGQVLKYRELAKASSTYGETFIEKYVEDGYVYADYNISEAQTGRMSCVSGATLIHTNRGSFRMDDYVLTKGDTVQTHTGAWMHIKRKIFKGYEPMISVHLDNGNVLQCTRNHRVLTSTGWEKLGNLHVGSEVYSYVSMQEVCNQSREYKKDSSSISGGRKEALHSDNSEGGEHDLSKCSVDYSNSGGWGTETSGKGNSDESSQDGFTQSELSKETKLHRHNWGWEWLSTAKNKREVYVRTSKYYGKSIGSRILAFMVGGSSYRRKQAEQRHRQPSIDNSFGSCKITYEVASITEIAPLGTMGVWDIEVTGDHSYLTCGFINHNSTDPNLQNIPNAKEYRSCFIASEGNDLGIIDYTAQEPCITADESQDGALLEIIKSGKDVHLLVGQRLFQDPTMVKSDPRRKLAKAMNLGMSYGLTAQGLQRKVNNDKAQDEEPMELEEAEEIVNGYFRQFWGVKQWIEDKRDFAKHNGYVETKSGRRMWVNRYSYSWLNNAINAPIQGGAADCTKLALVNFRKACKLSKVEFPVVNVVHDEIVLDVPKVSSEMYMNLLELNMCNSAMSIYTTVPFRGEKSVGSNWSVKS